MCSQGAIYLRILPWHYNDIRYQNNIVYVLINRAAYYAKTTWIFWKSKRSSVDSYGIKRCVTALPHVRKAYKFFFSRANYAMKVSHYLSLLMKTPPLQPRSQGLEEKTHFPLFYLLAISQNCASFSGRFKWGSSTWLSRLTSGCYTQLCLIHI